jgi:hypothetical protein
MKNAITIFSLLFLFQNAIAQNGNVGIGTTTPLARLHVKDSSVLFSGAGNVPAVQGLPPIQGPGRRMMWYADKAAFRSGGVSTTNWDKTNVGNYSAGIGYDNFASGEKAIAMGDATIASGIGSTAMGSGSRAAGEYSTAMGLATGAMGNASTAMGGAVRANADYSIAIGESVTANSWNSTSLGRHNNPIVQVPSSTWVLTEPLLIIGNGIPGQQKNALVIAKNGNTYIDPSNKNDGTLVGSSLLFGNYNLTGEGIGSNRNATLNKDGLDFYTAGINRITITHEGNVGINTITPLARLHILEGSVLFSAAGDLPVPQEPPPLQGGGRRMMWHADKAAFRAGYVIAANWDAANTGNYSTAFGYNSMAKGPNSFASGESTNASGAGSTALGKLTVASGPQSTAMGNQTTASGFQATTMGSQTTASSSYSTALGYLTTSSGTSSLSTGNSTSATGISSTAMGYGTSAGDYGTAMGFQSNAYGAISTAIGYNSNAYSYFETVIGANNTVYTPGGAEIWNPTDRLFVIGNGIDAGQRSNAMVVLKNGNTGIGNSTPTVPLSFANTTGPKISLYAGAANSHYGFGVQAYQLQVFANDALARISFGYYTSGAFTERMFLDNSSGILTVAGTNYTSDQRYKKQITPLQNPLEKIEAINGVEYYMRTDEYPSKHFNGELQVGLIAQEVEKILPQAVQTEEDGYKSLDYARIVPLLVEGIKEQQKQIAGFVKKSFDQQEQIDALTKHEKEQQQQLNDLKILVKKLIPNN